MKYNVPPHNEHLDSEMIKIEVNLDDIPGEWLGYIMDKLFELGANDVFYTPIYMKKNRPGVLLQLLCNKSKITELTNVLFKETTTLGVRYYPLTVHRMERRFITVKTKWGEVKVKQGIYNGEIHQNSPEYEDCKNIANEYNLPLKTIYEEVWKTLYNPNGLK